MCAVIAIINLEIQTNVILDLFNVSQVLIVLPVTDFNPLAVVFLNKFILPCVGIIIYGLILPCLGLLLALTTNDAIRNQWVNVMNVLFKYYFCAFTNSIM